MFILITVSIINLLKDFWLLPLMLSMLLITFYLKFPFSSMIISSLFLDKASFYLVFLSTFIMILMFFASTMFYYKSFFLKQYKIMLNFLNLFLIMSFISLDMMNFYLWFESSLIPIFLLVYGWGVQPERMEASVYLMGYTLMASFPLLIFILMMSKYSSTTNFILWSFVLNKSTIMAFHMYIIYFAFLVKVPMFILHLWLPKVHVEASLSGSMILAAIMLKLGAYGMLRIMIFNTLKSTIFLIISLMGGAMIAFICMRQTDLKTLVAYSSVVHMSFIIGSCFSEMSLTYLGSLLMMISHGLSSSCLFYLVNMYYERTGSRNIIINKGMSSLIPIFMLWWMVFSALSISAPFSLNFFSEIILMLNMITHSKFMLIILALLSIMTSCYVIFMFSFSQLNANSINNNLITEKTLDHLSCLSHALFLIVSATFINLL